MSAPRFENAFFIALLAITIVLAWFILAPYLTALFLAAALAIVFRPLYRKLLKILRYEFLTSIITVFIIVIVVFIPLGFFAVRIVSEASTLYAVLVSNGGVDVGSAVTHFLRANIHGLSLPDLSVNFNDSVQQGLAWLIQNLSTLFSRIAEVLFATFLSLFGLFYLLKDGERLRKWTIDLVPLEPQYTDQILNETESVVGSVLRGTLAVVVLQGIVAAAGFFLFQVPNPIFWGAVTMLFSLVPIVGTWLVVVPAILYLFFSGEMAAAFGLAVWGLLFVNLIYNVVSPQLMRRGAHMHPYVILLSVLGGISLFGPIGFIIGPCIIALLFSLLNIYPKLVTSPSAASRP